MTQVNRFKRGIVFISNLPKDWMYFKNEKCGSYHWNYDPRQTTIRISETSILTTDELVTPSIVSYSMKRDRCICGKENLPIQCGTLVHDKNPIKLHWLQINWTTNLTVHICQLVITTDMDHSNKNMGSVALAMTKLSNHLYIIGYKHYQLFLRKASRITNYMRKWTNKIET